jgi:hypothetical protein
MRQRERERERERERGRERGRETGEEEVRGSRKRERCGRSPSICAVSLHVSLLPA